MLFCSALINSFNETYFCCLLLLFWMCNTIFTCLAMNRVPFFMIIIKNQVKLFKALFAVGSLPVVQSAVASTTEFTPQTLINNTSHLGVIVFLRPISSTEVCGLKLLNDSYDTSCVIGPLKTSCVIDTFTCCRALCVM